MTGLGDDLDLPFEAGDGGQMADIDDAIIAGGVVVLATVVDVPELGKCPGLVFRFAQADGTMHRPILLVARDDQLAKLRPLVNSAVATARRAAAGHAE